MTLITFQIFKCLLLKLWSVIVSLPHLQLLSLIEFDSFIGVVMEPQGSMLNEEDIVIAGAGLSGLSTALGLHRNGIRCLVLESSDMLRVTGFALTLWTNAWRALDILGIGHSLRERSLQIHGVKVASQDSSSKQPRAGDVKVVEFESRCVKRKDLLETLGKELPEGTIRYSSKIVSIQKSGNFTLVHLADGTIIKTKVLIGCDGVNSMVAKWLGLQDPVSVGRCAIRGSVEYPDGHGFEQKFHGYFEGGVRFGFIPCDERTVYWFCTFTPSRLKYDENQSEPLIMKQFVLNSISNAPKGLTTVVEKTGLDSISCATLKFRSPWNVLVGNIVKDNVCVAGEALHPMTPDIGQEGCSSLEDGIVLVRCLTGALTTISSPTDEGYAKGLQKYAKERRWRCFSLISTAYIIGWIQQNDGKLISFLRKKYLARYSLRIMVKMAQYDFGKVSTS